MTIEWDAIGAFVSSYWLWIFWPWVGERGYRIMNDLRDLEPDWRLCILCMLLGPIQLFTALSGYTEAQYDTKHWQFAPIKNELILATRVLVNFGRQQIQLDRPFLLLLMEPGQQGLIEAARQWFLETNFVLVGTQETLDHYRYLHEQYQGTIVFDHTEWSSAQTASILVGQLEFQRRVDRELRRITRNLNPPQA